MKDLSKDVLVFKTYAMLKVRAQRSGLKVGSKKLKQKAQEMVERVLKGDTHDS